MSVLQFGNKDVFIVPQGGRVVALPTLARENAMHAFAESMLPGPDPVWYLRNGGKLRNLVIAETAATVSQGMTPVLAWFVDRGVRYALFQLSRLPFRRQPPRLRAEFASSSNVVSQLWVRHYTAQLGAGLGGPSADGLLTSLSTLQRMTVAERMVWDTVYGLAGLPQGETTTALNVAQKRLELWARTRRPLRPTDLAADVAKLLLSRRTQRIMSTESVVARNFGTLLTLMNAERLGYIPTGERKVWATAVDERVCPVCAPMDMVAAKLEDRFLVRQHRGVLSHDQHLYAPPAHTNCRCRIVPESAIRHGIITRTARFANDSGRARLTSRVEDIIEQGPEWTHAAG